MKLHGPEVPEVCDSGSPPFRVARCQAHAKRKPWCSFLRCVRIVICLHPEPLGLWQRKWGTSFMKTTRVNGFNVPLSPALSYKNFRMKPVDPNILWASAVASVGQCLRRKGHWRKSGCVLLQTITSERGPPPPWYLIHHKLN